MVEASKKIRTYMRSPDRLRRNFSNKIAVCGKGGVGKSTVVALLANALDEKGRAVVVVDCDDSNPGLCWMLGIDEEPKPLAALLERSTPSTAKPETGWLTRDEFTTPEIPSEFLGQRDGLKFITMGKIKESSQGCACNMTEVVREFIEKLVLGENEVVVIDVEAGIESFGRGVERNVDTVLIVVEPSYDSMALAEKISYMADGIGVNRVNAVLNKVSSEEKEVRMKTSLLRKSIRPIGSILQDSKIGEANFEGRALIDSVNSQTEERARKIASRLIEEPD
jgi:CO dehydrogenase maturation factor